MESVTQTSRRWAHMAQMQFSRASMRQRYLGIAVVLLLVMVTLMHHTPSLRDPSSSIFTDSLGLLNGYYGGGGATYAPDYKPMSYELIKEKLTFKRTSTKRRAEIIKDNMKYYSEFVKNKISEPKTGNLKRAPAKGEEYQRANATLSVLVRNREKDKLVDTMKDIEAKFNGKFHYPYTFINDEPFTADFKAAVEAVASGEVEYVVLTAEQWETPSHLDQSRIMLAFDKLEEQHINYAMLLSYRHMCRFNSATFYNIPAMQKYKWYWRFEPETQYYCDIDYDLFHFMEDNNKTYGFNINLYDNPITIETLWPVTMDFVKDHPEYVHPNAAFEWLTNDLQNPWHAEYSGGYSGCHFWSNFEIANMDFYRSEPYSKWMERLEADGGFYYERWGDAPVHSIGVGLFEDKSKIHWFRDVGYRHGPYSNCPASDKCKGCNVAEFGTPYLHTENCMAQWIEYSMDEKDRKMY